ncbi:molybdopterin-synthase adenylyltransferase MoeB [Opitutaceae bacterium]
MASRNYHLPDPDFGVLFANVASTLNPAELTRYSRHVLLDEIGVSGQERLKAARILVIGAGGLGSPASLYLAAAGVGTIGIADFDTVAAHNLQRQLLHSDATVGQSKVSSAVARLHATNPYATIREHPEGITAENALGLFASYDIIVDGTDNFATRYLTNDAAVLARRPLVHGSIFKFEGQVTVFAPHLGGPCYRCLFPHPPTAGAIPNCAEAGVLGALCGVIGSLQAIEAIKLGAGFGQPLIGRLLTYDALNQSFGSLTLPRDPECPACGPRATLRELRAETYSPRAATCAAPPPVSSPSMSPDNVPLEISIEDAKRLLDATADRVLLIDVREPHEVVICRIEGTVHIPMRQVPEQVDQLPRDRHLLIHCHHGGRSLRVTEFLRARGFAMVSNVAGGIDAWAAQIEPKMARY